MKLLPRYAFALACAGAIVSTAAMSADCAPDAPPGPPPDESLQRPPGPRGAPMSDEQQRKAFAITHAAAAAMFDHQMALRQAQQTLRDMAASGRLDEARALAAANIVGSASAAIALNRARIDAQLAALLGPGQHAPMGGAERPRPR
jgi:Spy/CpxP family protein refolding chaperone